VVRGQVNQALAGSPLGPVLVSAMSLSGSAIEVSWPGVGCDQYRAKRPLSLLPSSAWPANSSSLPSSALARTPGTGRAGRVGLQCGLDLAGQVLAQVEGIEEALFGLFAQEQHLAEKPCRIGRRP
jgi:hypothetical protein